MRRIRFKPTLREQQQQNLAAERHYASFAPAEKMAAAAERIQQLEASIKPKRERAAPRALEADVVRAIKQLLATHPKILWVLRMNAGSASYEAKSGKWAPVKFHEWLRCPEKMRMSDFYGMLVDGRPIAVEAKAPGFQHPRDDREHEQAAFLRSVRFLGGIGIFACSVDDVAKALR